MTDLSNYSSIHDLIEYYLVLEALQEDLLYQEAQNAKAQEIFSTDQKSVEEYRRRIPMIVFTKESKILELKSQLTDLKNEIAQLEEQVCISLSLSLIQNSDIIF